MVQCAPARPPAKPALPALVLREEDALTDAGPDAGMIPLGPPPAPLPWQKTQPCDAWEHAINGACYIRMEEEAMKPPCAPGFVEHKRRCYKAIAKATQQPVSDPP